MLMFGLNFSVMKLKVVFFLVILCINTALFCSFHLETIDVEYTQKERVRFDQKNIISLQEVDSNSCFLITKYLDIIFNTYCKISKPFFSLNSDFSELIKSDFKVFYHQKFSNFRYIVVSPGLLNQNKIEMLRDELEKHLQHEPLSIEVLIDNYCQKRICFKIGPGKSPRISETS
jgi:hypothetical protein